MGNRCGSNPAIGSEYCNNHQNQASKPRTKPPFYKNSKFFKGLIGLILTLLIGFIGYVLYPIITDKITDPLSVSPEEITISPIYGKLDKEPLEFPFSLINERNKHIYGVWLKLIPIGPPDMCSSIEAVPTTLHPGKVLVTKNNILYKDMFWFKAFDESGLKCMWIYIIDIEPLQNIPFKLRVLRPDLLQKRSAELKVKLKLQGKYYSEKPRPFSFEEESSGNYKFSTNLTPPENIKKPGKYGAVLIPTDLLNPYGTTRSLNSKKTADPIQKNSTLTEKTMESSLPIKNYEPGTYVFKLEAGKSTDHWIHQPNGTKCSFFSNNGQFEVHYRGGQIVKAWEGDKHPNNDPIFKLYAKENTFIKIEITKMEEKSETLRE